MNDAMTRPEAIATAIGVPFRAHVAVPVLQEYPRNRTGTEAPAGSVPGRI